MKGFIQIAIAIFIGWLILRWLSATESVDLGGTTLAGWPYAAPLAGPVKVRTWSPPYGSNFNSLYSFRNAGPNEGPNIAFGGRRINP